jgi:hypothetical protein
MGSRVLAFALMVMAQAGDINPDWKKLTDFSTDVKVDLDSLIPAMRKSYDEGYKQCVQTFQDEAPDYCHKGSTPLKTMEGDFKVQLDVPAERFKIEANARAEYSDSEMIPPPLRGAQVSGKGTLAFDATAGFLLVKEKGVVNSQFDYEFCAKVHFPQGLLPPGQMIMAQLDGKKQQVTDGLNQMPHTEATVDGNSVVVYSQPGNPPNPSMYAAMMHDATPVGFGINTAPSGTWADAVIKFNGWTAGAGAIADEPCAEVSATELLQNPHAIRSLWAFDQVMDLMNKQEPLKSVLSFVPAQPSKIFESAVRLENLEVRRHRLNEMTEVSHSISWGMVAMAAVGGVVGASLVLLLTKTRMERAPGLLA